MALGERALESQIRTVYEPYFMITDHITPMEIFIKLPSSAILIVIHNQVYSDIHRNNLLNFLPFPHHTYL